MSFSEGYTKSRIMNIKLLNLLSDPRKPFWKLHLFALFFKFYFINGYDLTFSFMKLLAVRIGIIYLLSGFGGSVLSTLFISNNISVGASGALFGLLGAMLSELLTNWTIYSNKVSVAN